MVLSEQEIGELGHVEATALIIRLQRERDEARTNVAALTLAWDHMVEMTSEGRSPEWVEIDLDTFNATVDAFDKPSPGQHVRDRMEKLGRALKIISTDDWGPNGGDLYT